ncbi:antibiotic biosynthesis monooxygenase [Phaeobacter sp. HF9A]|uniref:antibiotic biosynthesis monooxygenase family protein n=1 Tax=Phaeobacter sp. HF9A TaxID=2721561 RepID=UPI0014305344|nr:hypothetical protein [Phaeobacter sp. HF9A]NIZ15665.1 hypothetical protein [Phaeobacter sp. HF9A]
MTNTVIEVVTFKLKADVSEADYVAATEKSQRLIGGMPGFISRSLSKGADGSWTDYTIWVDMASAEAAMAQFPQADCTADVMRMIDPSTLVMRHETQQWARRAEPVMA